MGNCETTAGLLLGNRSRHFIFDHGGIVFIRPRAASSGESQTLVEAEGGFVASGNHQQQGTRFAQMCPFENLFHQQPAYTPPTVCRGGPHGDQERTTGVALDKKGVNYAACLFTVHRQESSPSLTMHAFGARKPLGLGQLRLFGIGGSECLRGVFESTQANRSKHRYVQRRDWLDDDHERNMCDVPSKAQIFCFP
jgi:hypothetical protein